MQVSLRGTALAGYYIRTLFRLSDEQCALLATLLDMNKESIPLWTPHTEEEVDQLIKELVEGPNAE